MGKNEAQRQKKLAKKRSREIEKRKRMAREKSQMSSFAGQWKMAMKGRFGKIWIGDSLGETGIGQVIVTRQLPDHRVATVRFLIDAYCLGVKQVEVEFEAPSRVNKMVEMLEERGHRYRTDVTPADAARVVQGAVRFAEQIGLSPHPMYRQIAGLFDDVDPNQATYELEFGRGGKPLLIPGPHDSPDQIARILEDARAAGHELGVDFQQVNDFDQYDFEALDDPELDVDIDEDVMPAVLDALANGDSAMEPPTT